MNVVDSISPATGVRPDMGFVQDIAERIISETEKVIIGKRDVIRLATAAILCEGHALLEDVPGIGKTMLARALASALGGEFSRIQFTPDLLPTDITGALVFDPKTTDFVYRQGPIVTNILLADEINRAGPRTQSALLEAMEERQVSVERQRVRMPQPFFVIATQNPVEMEGTFPLPEAQLDRFLMRLSIGYPDFEDEREVLRRFREEAPLASVRAVTSPEHVTEAIAMVRRVHISRPVEDYLLAIVRATRDDADIALGASTRAALGLARASQARAAMDGRNFVLPDDVKAMATPVLAHRIMASVQADLRGMATNTLVDRVVASIPVPVEGNEEGLDRVRS